MYHLKEPLLDSNIYMANRAVPTSLLVIDKDFLVVNIIVQK